jgi:hypothetical protein
MKVVLHVVEAGVVVDLDSEAGEEVELLLAALLLLLLPLAAFLLFLLLRLASNFLLLSRSFLSVAFLFFASLSLLLLSAKKR